MSQRNRMSLRDMADMVRSQGTEGDTVLAHIHPHEANMLESMYGGEINPHTGLPEYGRFFKNVGKIFKKALPIIGAGVGAMAGGPMGATIGGSIGGALSSKNHRMQHALGGAGLGAALGFAMPMLSGGMGGGGTSMLGGLFGGGQQGQGSMLGGLFGGSSPMANMGRQNAMQSLQGVGQNMGQMSQGGGGEGVFGNIMGALNSDPMRFALLATSVAGSLGRRERIPEEQKQTAEQIAMAHRRPGLEAAHARPLNRRYRPAPSNYRPGVDPEHVFFEDVTPPTEFFAKGGYVDGNSGGQEDDAHFLIPHKSYIMDATTVSLLGDGNSNNGAERFVDFEQNVKTIKKKNMSDFSKSGIYRDDGKNKNVRVRLSSGEYRISPETVESLGNGNFENGVKKLDKFRKNIRAQKGIKKKLPPKSKPISSYMR